MIRNNILIFNTCTTLLNNNPHHKKEKKLHDIKIKSMYQMLKNALCTAWYSIQIESMPFIHLSKGLMLYAGLINFSTVTFIYGIFVSMKYVLFRMIISIFYCLKFFTIKCASFCSLWRGEKNEKSEETRLQMHAPVHFVVI